MRMLKNYTTFVKKLHSTHCVRHLGAQPLIVRCFERHRVRHLGAQSFFSAVLSDSAGVTSAM